MNPQLMPSIADAWSYQVATPLGREQLDKLLHKILSLGPYDGGLHLARFGLPEQGQVLAELTRRSFALRHENPKRSLKLMDFAQMLLWQVPGKALQDPAMKDIYLAVRGFLANALRVAGEIRDAGKVWAELSSCPPPLTDNVYLHGLLLEFQASFARSRRDFAAVERSLEQAEELYRRVDARHFLGSVKVIQSGDAYFQGKPGVAMEQLMEGLRHLDPNRGTGQSIFALHNAVVYLVELGYIEQAVFVFEQIECLYFSAGRMMVLRAGWLKGQIALKGGNISEATELLDRARRELLEQGLSYDAALAGLDLALAYSEAQDLVAVMRLAEEMYPVFVAHDIPREASAALLQFYRSAEDLRINSRMIRATIAHLAELGRRPSGAVPE